MDNDGMRFKSEYDASSAVIEAEADFADDGRDRADRLKEKQSKKVEKMLAKKRRHLLDDKKNSAAETPEEPSADTDRDPLDEGEPPLEDPLPVPAPDAPDDDKDRAAAQDERLREKNAKKLDHLMKKQRRREDKSDRKVLSYEDMPLEERAAAKKKSKVKVRRKRIILAGVIVLLLVGLVFLFTNNDRLSLHNISNFIRYGIFNMDSDQRFPVQNRDESISSGNFCRMGQDLCYATDSKLQTLNNYGVRMLTETHGYSSPYLVCSDKYSLLYNLGGTEFRINTLSDHVYTGNAANKILVADITDKGVYALVTQKDGYLSKLYVYDSDDNDNLLYAYSFGDYYVTSVSLKPNGKMAVVAGISAHNGNEISSLYVLDFYKDSPAQFVELEDTVIYDVQFLGSTYAAAVGSKGAYVIDTGDGDVEMTDFEGKTLTAYTFNTDTDTFSVSLSRSGDGRNCDIWSFDSDGDLSKSFSTDLRVISISSYKGRVALLTTDTVYLYSKGGDQVGKEDAGIDPRSVVLYTSADAYLLDAGEIRAVSL